MTLTLEQKVKRAVRRINKKLQSEYPLIADQILTSEAEQFERYAEIETSNKAYIKKIDDLEAEFRTRAETLRVAAAGRYSQEELARMDEYCERVLGNLSAAYLADYWGKKVAT